MTQDLSIQEKKATLEQAGWKIFVASDDNRESWWHHGMAITPDGFITRTDSRYHSSWDDIDTSEITEDELDELYEKRDQQLETEYQEILQEIVNKAWNRYRKD